MFLANEKSIIWSNDITKKNLINYNAVVNNFIDEVVITTILNKIVTNKKKLDVHMTTINIFSINSSK